MVVSPFLQEKVMQVNKNVYLCTSKERYDS